MWLPQHWNVWQQQNCWVFSCKKWITRDPCCIVHNPEYTQLCVALGGREFDVNENRMWLRTAPATQVVRNHASWEHQVRGHVENAFSALATHSVNLRLTWVNPEMYPLQGTMPPLTRDLYIRCSPGMRHKCPFTICTELKLPLKNPLDINL